MVSVHYIIMLIIKLISCTLAHLLFYSGSTLPYCQTDKFQCCTIEYLENKETNTRLNLSASLREEFMRGNFEILSSTVMSLENRKEFIYYYYNSIDIDFILLCSLQRRIFS